MEVFVLLFLRGSFFFQTNHAPRGGGEENNAYWIHGTGPGIEQANPSRDPYNGLL